MDFSSLLIIFNYVAVAYGLMRIGKACGLNNPWLSWIPFARDYQLGAVADHYTANYQSRTTRSRITLLVMNIGTSIVAVVALSVILSSVYTLMNNIGLDLTQLVSGTIDPEALENQLEQYFKGMSEAELMGFVTSFLGAISVPALILAVVAIVYFVFYFIALYRVYNLVDPEHAALYIVLSIIFTNVAPGIIFLIIANKMPTTPNQPTPPPFEETPSGPYSV